MAHSLHLLTALKHRFARRPAPQPAPPSPVQQLAHQYTGKYAFLDEQTNKTHQLIVGPSLEIQIDGRTLPGQVTGITLERLTFLDHYGYQLIIATTAAGPTTVYDEAEDTTYQIIQPTPDAQ
ncbi:DUF4828 domain-containing protein [Lacticaseibacillus daqingensis]|uniref:DUF4828 domain-containing protein n=1 Tax=Lacticaseibacillus daqingensis TaxID=2486014 RepID=UPI000F791B59|nr:DUF4828 domain-containing protein [Lacticaseibacillus daqingensis]